VGLQKNAPAMNVVVDTCVWTQFFRRDRPKADPVAWQVERLIRSDSIQILGPIRQELLSGAQPRARFERLREYLRFYPNLPLDEQDDETAADFYNICRGRGVQGTAIDLLICAAAARHGLPIFTTDLDFGGYAKCLPIKLFLRR
jgi:predicted nucleic acid-binding protein